MRAALLSTGRGSRDMPGRGLTAALREAFFPEYDYAVALSRRPRPARRGKPGEGGLRRGRRVDAEISAWADRGRLPREAHNFTKKFVKFCEMQRWTPAASQVVVGDPALGLATMLDVVLVTEARELVVIEVKCGFAGVHDVPLGFMRSPFSRYNDSPRNQHLLQLGFGVAFFKKTFSGVFGKTPLAAYLVRIVESGVEVTALSRGVLSACERGGAKTFKR